MVDLETRMKMDTLLDYAYDNTIERMNAIETAPRSSIYQTISGMKKGNPESFAHAYANYYFGCLEGIFFTRFLEAFNRMPTPSENAFIVETIKTKFAKMIDLVTDLATKKFKENP